MLRPTVVTMPPLASPAQCEIPYFELRTCLGKGIGLFALRDIAHGQRLIAEAPLCVIEIADEVTDWHDKVVAAFTALSPAEQSIFLALHHDPSVSSAETRSAHDSSECRLRNTFDLNAFGLELGNDKSAAGVMHLASRLNHSCRPNVFCAFNDRLGLFTTHAIRNIKAGEELETSYIIGSYLGRQDRQALLQRYGFHCSCAACEDTTGRSDARRATIKLLDSSSAKARRDCLDLNANVAGKIAAHCSQMAELMSDENLTGPDLADASVPRTLAIHTVANLAYSYLGAAICSFIAGRHESARKCRALSEELLVKCYGADNPIIEGSSQ